MDIAISRIGFDHDEPLNEAVVKMLCSEIRKGKKLPMPVLMRTGKGYAVVDGRSRIKAAERSGATKIAAYVIAELCPRSMRDLRKWLNDRRPSNLKGQEVARITASASSPPPSATAQAQ